MVWLHVCDMWTMQNGQQVGRAARRLRATPSAGHPTCPGRLVVHAAPGILTFVCCVAATCVGAFSTVYTRVMAGAAVRPLAGWSLAYLSCPLKVLRRPSHSMTCRAMLPRVVPWHGWPARACLAATRSTTTWCPRACSRSGGQSCGPRG